MLVQNFIIILDKEAALLNVKQFNSLITGLLVDGFTGFAFRGRKAAERKPSKIGKSDLVAVYAVCEMVLPGVLQTEMFYSNWYESDYGLDPVFCDHIAAQFADQTP